MRAARAGSGGVDPVEGAAWLGVAVALLFQNPYGDFGPESDRYLLLAGVALATCALLAVTARYGERPGIALRSPMPLVALAFAATALLSALFAVDPWRSLPGAPPRLSGLAGELALATLFFALAPRLASRAARGRLDGAMALAGAATIAYAVVQWAGFDPVRWSLDWQGRPTAAQGNPLFLGQALVWVAPLLAARALARFRSGGVEKAWASALLAALALAIVARSGARGALAGLAVAGLVFALLGLPNRVALLGLLKRPLPVALTAAALLAGITLWGARSGGELSGTAGQRALLWRAAVERLRTAPPARLLVGFGQDSGSIALAPFVPPELPERIWRPDLYHDRAHNAALDALLAGGLLRAAALSALFALAVAGAARRVAGAANAADEAIAAGWLAAILGHGVAIAFGIATAATSLCFWIALAVVAGAETKRPAPETRADDPDADRARRLQVALVLLVAAWSGWVPAQVGGGSVATNRLVYFAGVAAALLLAGAAGGAKRGRLVSFAIAGIYLALHAALAGSSNYGAALALLLAFAAVAIVATAGAGRFRVPTAAGWTAIAAAAAGSVALGLATTSGIDLKSGRTLLAAGDSVAAEALLERATGRVPFFEEVPVALARARQRRAERIPDSGSREAAFADAESALVGAQRYHPEMSTLVFERAHLESRRAEATEEPEARRRRFESAAGLFRRGLALEPQASVAHRGLGAVLLELGETEAARSALAESVRLAPRSVEARLFRARAELAAGEIGTARAEVAAAVSVDAARARSILVALARARPNDASAYRDLALLDLAEGRPDRARAALQQAMSVADPEEVAQLLELLELAGGSG